MTSSLASALRPVQTLSEHCWALSTSFLDGLVNHARKQCWPPKLARGFKRIVLQRREGAYSATIDSSCSGLYRTVSPTSATRPDELGGLAMQASSHSQLCQDLEIKTFTWDSRIQIKSTLPYQDSRRCICCTKQVKVGTADCDTFRGFPHSPISPSNEMRRSLHKER